MYYEPTFSERLKSQLGKVASWFDLVGKLVKPLRDGVIVIVGFIVAMAVPTGFERPAGLYEASTIVPQWANLNSDFWGTPANGLEVMKFDIVRHDAEKMLMPFGGGSRITFKKSGIYLISVSVPINDKGLTSFGAITIVRNSDIDKRTVLASVVNTSVRPEAGWSNTLSGVRSEDYRAGDTLDFYLTLRSRVNERPLLKNATLSVVMINAETTTVGNLLHALKGIGGH